MRAIITMILSVLLSAMAMNAKPRCQSFNNNDEKVTIVFTDDNPGNHYRVTDVKLIPSWNGKSFTATSVKVNMRNDVATVTLIFPHLTHFSNPKVELMINGKKSKFKVCQ